ncbi:MAG: GIY-YIG nuclease family protein [Candidatus Cloacimonetes bacterium]|nr:GIY-YIG nuclease family protein [Candidatus Cloacimonadota bacterium]
MFYTYILYSDRKDKYYIGHTHNLVLRLERHNSGRSRFTKAGIPWIIVYYEEYETKSEAMRREYELKKQKNRKYIINLIDKKR